MEFFGHVLKDIAVILVGRLSVPSFFHRDHIRLKNHCPLTVSKYLTGKCLEKYHGIYFEGSSFSVTAATGKVNMDKREYRRKKVGLFFRSLFSL